MRLLGAFLRRDFRIERSYRLAFATQLGGAALTLLSSVFLSKLVPGHQASLRPYGGDYFTFVLIGTGALSFFSVGLGGFSGTLSGEQSQGTLESLLVTPNDPRALLAYGAGWPFAFSTIQLVIYLLVGVVAFGAHVPARSLALAGSVLLLSLVAFSAVGLLAAAVVVVTKRAGVLVTVTAAAFSLLGGVIYPVSVLPRPLQWLAEALPMTHGLDGVRRALLPHPDLGAVGIDVAVLAAFTVVLLPAALITMGWCVDLARRSGSLAHY